MCAAGSNTVSGDHGCVACAEHEIAVNDACTCAAGYQVPSGGTACVIVPKALGDSCASDAECTDATYDSCRLNGDTGYCTSTGCTTNDDCAGGYACNVSGDPSFCQRPPVGQGMACTSSRDCAGTEAPYCLTIQANTCFVPCSLTGNDCFAGYQCCDLPKASANLIPKPLCLPSGTCPV